VSDEADSLRQAKAGARFVDCEGNVWIRTAEGATALFTAVMRQVQWVDLEEAERRFGPFTRQPDEA
jgi:hypothetical protein